MPSKVFRAIEEKPLGNSERNQLLKIVLGLALATYNHDPKAKRTDTATQVVSDLGRFGITINDDTVRKYLKEAEGSVTYTMPTKA